ncbi:MAG TPA: PQQ-binding-like beta-propeller repeat protein, partial [Micromonosporaceae bacterium]|nr:PQQ-binding-like beta-propeller repeat protein [Micromonosporaceae bacterium]
RSYRAVSLLVVLALAASLAGSAPVADPLVEARLPMAFGEQMQVAGDRIYIIGESRGGTREIRAYGLPDGEPLWRSRIEGVGGDIGPQVVVDSVLLMGRYDEDISELIALDAATGAPLWRRTGWSMGQTRGPAPDASRILVSSGGPTPETADRLEVVSSVDPRTGAEAWSYEVPAAALVNAVWDGSVSDTARVTHLVTGLRSGVVEVRDAVTGTLVSSQDTGPPVADVVPGQPQNWLATVDDLLLVQEPDQRSATVYGLPGLERRWGIELDSSAYVWYVGPYCGELLCLQGPDRGIMALDRATGELRWSATWTYLTPVGSSLLASRADGALGGETPLWLVDPATGRARAGLGQWAIAGAGFGVGYGQGVDPLVIRQDLLTQRTWFGVVDDVAGTVRLLGVVTGVVGECHAGASSLICRRKDLSVGIWRYR